MIRKVALLSVIMALFAGSAFAQEGKVRGRVMDKEKGEPIIGANVIIVGTTLGATTDIDGEYIILSVPAGVHTVKVSFVGYSPVTISNIRVNANITTTLDFEMSEEAIGLQAVEIIGTQPLIQRNTTNTTRLTTQENIRSLPIRGVQNILALEAGVVQAGGNLYVRGGRAGDVKYYVEGANVTNPLFNTEGVSIIQEALEEVQLQSGGYTADVSGGNAGAVRTTMRTGGEKYNFSVDFRTDDFVSGGNEFIGTTSRGYRNLAATVGGPITKDLRFFAAGQHNYQRNKQSIFLEPFKFDGLTTVQITGGQPAGTPLPGPIEIQRNFLDNNWAQTNQGQATLLYNISSAFKVRLAGTYSMATQKNANWPGHLDNIFRLNRVTESETETFFTNLRFTHLINPKTYYEVGVSYQNRFARTYDPDFGDDWKLYADSAANAEKGYTGFRAKWSGPLAYFIITDFGINHENAPNNGYSKNNQSNIGATVDFVSQLSPEIELKAGGSMEMWTMRSWNIGNIAGFMRLQYGTDGNTPAVWPSAGDSLRQLTRQAGGNVNYYGYRLTGEEGEDVEPAKEPLFIAGYLQTKFEYRDLILNLGARVEHFNIDAKVPENPGDRSSYLDTNDVIDMTKLKDADPFTLFLPRISFSFPVSDNTVFFAQYGKYAQLPSLNQVYSNNVFVSRTVGLQTSGNAFLTPIGTLIKPERTTQYEVGFRQTISDNVAFTLSGYYKDLRDQISVRKYVSDGVALFNAYLNEDFSTVKGLEATVELRRTNRLQAKLNYTMSSATGTGSNSQSGFGVVESNIFDKFPNFIYPMDFNRTHSGSVVFDYRFAKGDGGKVLEGFGVNAIFRFASGVPYTRIQSPTSLGQAETFEFGVRPISDPRSRVPVEPLNSSTGPWTFNLDLSVSKAFFVGPVTAELYVNVLNFFNTKNVTGVFPITGTAQDDGWLASPLAATYKENANYIDFYKAVNLNNRYFLLNVGGGDVYSSPREIRVGVNVIM